MQAGDERTGFWGYMRDQATLAGVMVSGGVGVGLRMHELKLVSEGKFVNPSSRLGAFAATCGYPEGTVGYAVNRAIGLIYVSLGTYGEEQIGTVFNSAAARFHYPNPVDGPSSQAVARMEFDYWSRVRGEDPWSPGSNIATAFDPKTRDWLQRRIFS